MNRTILLLFALAASCASVFCGDRQIAFERDQAVWIANLDGTGEKKIADGIFPAISPDGTRVAFNTTEKTSDTTYARHIAVINVATGKIEMLSVYGMWTEDGQSLQHPSASVLAPDGRLYVADTTQHRVFRIADIPAQAPDTTPPDIHPVLEGTLGDNGWYTSNVRVLFYVTEIESSTQYSPGCNVVTVSQDTPGTTFTCTATSGGGSTTRSLTVKRDATPPALAFGTPSPVPNANG